MIDKKENCPDTPDSTHLAQMCHNLEEKRAEACEVVQSTFKNLFEMLKNREKQLLRQIDAVHTQQMAHIQSRPDTADSIPYVVVQMDQEKDVKEIVMTLGHVGLQGGCFFTLNSDADNSCSFLNRLEEYQDAKQDHISMIKPVPLESSDSSDQEIIRFHCVNLRLCNKALSNMDVEPVECDSNETKEDLSESPSEEQKESATEENSHPAQIQQWLKQISAETETEPSIGEPKHFVVLSNNSSETS